MKTIPPATLAGLSLSLLGFFIVAAVTQALSEQVGTIWGLVLVWLLTLFLLLLIRRGENLPFTSIGIVSISIKEGLFALVMGIVLSLSVPVLTLLASQVLPSGTGGSLVEVTSQNAWFPLFLSVLTAGVTEEIIFRGYVIERFCELTGKSWLAVGISVIAFVLPHTFSWNLTHLVGVVLPLGLILSGIYLWKRNLLFNMIVHIVINLPLVFMALASNQS